jgi:putative transposase
VIAFIDAHREEWRVEPICRVLGVASSTYYAAKARVPSARELADRPLVPQILDVWREHEGIYGVRKLWHALRQAGIPVGRERLLRLMRTLGIAGITWARKTRTTIPAAVDHPGDLVCREFRAPAPDRLWVADITYVALATGGFAYTAFVTDVFSRMIVGWRIGRTLATELALGALADAQDFRAGDLRGLVHHSDRGVQYRAIRYTDRMADAGIVPSVGSKGDSYDNAMAESVNSLYKKEVIHRFPGRTWRSVAEVELATADWVRFYNYIRLHSELGYVPPAACEQAYWARPASLDGAA